MVDPDARYLYYVLDKGKAIRYGVTVGEEALVFSGVAKVGRREEWPSWTPTADIKKRLGDIPDFVGPGPHNPLGARGLYLFSGNRRGLRPALDRGQHRGQRDQRLPRSDVALEQPQHRHHLRHVAADFPDHAVAAHP